MVIDGVGTTVEVGALAYDLVGVTLRARPENPDPTKPAPITGFLWLPAERAAELVDDLISALDDAGYYNREENDGCAT